MPIAGRTQDGFSQLEKVYVNIGKGLVYVKFGDEMTSSAWAPCQAEGHRHSLMTSYPAEEDPRDRARRAISILAILPYLERPSHDVVKIIPKKGWGVHKGGPHLVAT